MEKLSFISILLPIETSEGLDKSITVWFGYRKKTFVPIRIPFDFKYLQKRLLLLVEYLW